MFRFVIIAFSDPSPLTMLQDTRPLLLAAGLSLATTLLLVPLIKRVTFALGQISRPRSDRWSPTPRPKALFGGVAILCGFWFALLTATMGPVAVQWRILLAGNLAFAAIGFFDDLYELRPATKVVCQLVASLVPIALGLSIPGLNAVASQLIAMVWIVVVVNAVNLLDNMDGLAAGVAAVAAAFLTFEGIQGGNLPLAIASTALVGGCVGFLFFNFPPSSIFMGDTGSHFLGYTLAALTLMDAAQTRTTIFAAMLGPALVLLVPIFDTALVALSRFASGRPVTAGAADHSSHRLVSLGLSERQTALVLYALSIGGGLVSLAVSRLPVALFSVCLLLLLVAVYYFGNFLGHLPVYARTSDAVAAAKLRRMAVFNAFIPYKWPLLDVIADVCIVVGAHIGAYLLRFEGRIEGLNLSLLAWSLPTTLAARLIFFQVFGLYRRLTGHFSLADIFAIGKAVFASSAAAVTVLVIAFRFYGFSRAIILIDAGLTFGFIVAGHASLSLFSEFFQRRRAAAIKTLIVGAGDLGAAAAPLLRRDPDLPRTIVAYLDDDPEKIGRRLQGVPVDGPIDRLEEIVSGQNVTEVFFAIARPPSGLEAGVREVCGRLGIPVRRVLID
jgi:UDP-GlcNAc:undecaprenyl-phosphate GlcNAc-1-phosphate transferase